MRVIGNSIKIFGLAAIMFAFAGAALAAPSASAASLSFGAVSTITDPVPSTDPYDPAPFPVLGKLSVFAIDPTKDVNLAGATVVVYNGNAQVVAKALTDANGSASTYLAPGTYKVSVLAKGYKEHRSLVSITADQTTTVKAILRVAAPWIGVAPVNQ
jgi:hypothetical protein